MDKILKIRHTGIKLKKGTLLISTPLLNDFYFGHSVILLLEHDKKGSMGLILNNLLENKIGDIIPMLSEYNFPIFLGGPVDQNIAFYIHNNALIKDSIFLCEGLYWGGDINQIKEYINDGIITKKDIRFFLGYAGWSQQQLENEIKTDSWIITNINATEEIINSDNTNMWKTLVRSLGENYKQWFNFPINPLDN